MRYGLANIPWGVYTMTYSHIEIMHLGALCDYISFLMNKILCPKKTM